MNWLSNNSPKFLQAGARGKYTLTIKGDIQMGSLNTASVSESRYVFNVLNVDDKGYNLELLTLDSKLIEYNNPSLKDIDALNNMFKQIYNEIQFRINVDGKLEKITNLDQIKAKWQQVRIQLVEIQGQFVSIAQVLKLNDDLFNNDQLLIETILATEFFEWYLSIYERKNFLKKEVVKKSRFQMERIAWLFEYDKKSLSASTTSPIYRITINGINSQKPDQKWLKNAYGHFPYIDTTVVKPVFSTQAEYYINEKTGLIAEAIIKTEEVVHVGLLYSKMEYRFKLDDADIHTTNVYDAESQKETTKKSFSTLI